MRPSGLCWEGGVGRFGADVSCRIFTHLATLVHLAMQQ
jgi:hypothetical protein